MDVIQRIPIHGMLATNTNHFNQFITNHIQQLNYSAKE